MVKVTQQIKAELVGCPVLLTLNPGLTQHILQSPQSENQDIHRTDEGLRLREEKYLSSTFPILQKPDPWSVVRVPGVPGEGPSNPGTKLRATSPPRRAQRGPCSSALLSCLAHPRACGWCTSGSPTGHPTRQIQKNENKHRTWHLLGLGPHSKGFTYIISLRHNNSVRSTL